MFGVEKNCFSKSKSWRTSWRGWGTLVKRCLHERAIKNALQMESITCCLPCLQKCSYHLLQWELILPLLLEAMTLVPLENVLHTHTHMRVRALTHTLTEAGKPLWMGQGHCVWGWTPGSVWSLGLHLVAYGPMALKPWHLCFPTMCRSQRWPTGSRGHALAFLESGTADDQSVRLPFLDEKTKAQGVKKFARDVGMRPALFCFVWNSKVQQDWLGQKLNFKT